jgi:hypothetical protein
MSHGIKRDDTQYIYDVHGGLLGESAKPSGAVVSSVLGKISVDNCWI